MLYTCDQHVGTVCWTQSTQFALRLLRSMFLVPHYVCFCQFRETPVSIWEIKDCPLNTNVRVAYLSSEDQQCEHMPFASIWANINKVNKPKTWRLYSLLLSRERICVITEINLLSENNPWFRFTFAQWRYGFFAYPMTLWARNWMSHFGALLNTKR